MKKVIVLTAILLLAMAACSTPESTPQPNSAQNFTVEDVAGNSVALADFHGQPVVLNFWATWCPNCTRMMPALEEVYLSYGEDVKFLAINLVGSRGETPERALGHIENNGYTFPVYFDNQNVASRAFAVRSIPLTVFINAQGEVVHQQVGQMNESALRENIQRILSIS